MKKVTEIIEDSEKFDDVLKTFLNNRIILVLTSGSKNLHCLRDTLKFRRIPFEIRHDISSCCPIVLIFNMFVRLHIGQKLH
jgi:hypothetical protein